MPRGAPYLTKSRYLRGLTCARMIWRDWHQPTPYEEQPPGSPAALGTLVGEHAQTVFAGGVAVTEKPWQHDKAVATTRELMADPSVWAIFEAAFEHQDVRVRVDALERLGPDAWGIREVKSGTRLKDENVHDASVQLFVVRNSGVTVPSVELMHTDKTYVRDGDGIDWNSFFVREDITAEVEALQGGVTPNIVDQLVVLADSNEPSVEPSRHCPKTCDHWAHCTMGKPEYWTLRLPRMAQEKFLDLRDQGIEDVRDIPDSFELTDTQERARYSILTGDPYISPDLKSALAPLDGPALYLDFEAMNPATPLYDGMAPYQRVAFQWSLHVSNRVGQMTHTEFLADPADGDPRRAFAESLIKAVGGNFGPMVVYSSYEAGVLSELAEDFPDLADGLNTLRSRLFDLLPLVRAHVYHPDFQGSFSIKAVGPALAPEFGYDDLENVKDGAAAAQAYYRLATGKLMDSETVAEVRRDLLDYCARDTLAMIAVHKGLARLLNEDVDLTELALVG